MVPRASFALALFLLAHGVLADAPPKVRPLALERSAYLLGHASNPVLWETWGETAFERARREEKPIFLSIGYASCHWCHVMERESFTDAAVAEELNRRFVPILVDREEHPEVDATYIAFLQSMTGSAGWPANLILTPDLKPIIGGSYMKKEALTRLLEVIAGRWATERKALLDSSEQLVQMARSLAATPSPGELDPKVLDAISSAILRSYDGRNGGFGDAPKFPQPLTVSYLLRYAHRSGDDAARDAALDTLKQLASSGLRDHLAGGFHRYAVDAALREPHFEKMLYDQALLAIAYTEAWQVTKDAQYQSVAREILDYALRDLRAPNAAAFGSAQDSDTGQEEGAFYVWSKSELRTLLGEDAEIASRYFGINRERGNVLYIAEPELAAKAGSARQKMIAARRKRQTPLRDDKVLTAWNGLMISALARSGAAFDEPRYVDAAVGAAQFITSNLWNAKNQKLQRRWAAGHAGIDALPEDYAFLVQALLDLHESTQDIAWLELAVTLQTRQDALFWDGKSKRYRGGSSVPATLQAVAIESELALPGAGSVAAMNLLRLGELTDSSTLRDRANTLFESYGSRLLDGGAELPALASALLFAFSTPKQIVIAGDPAKDDTRALLRVVHERFVPNRVLVVTGSGASHEKLVRHMPAVKEMKPIGGRATAFICEHYVCKLPTADPVKVAKLLE
jgi:uncharacterized protein YyaL (SSP411 family)